MKRLTGSRGEVSEQGEVPWVATSLWQRQKITEMAGGGQKMAEGQADIS